MTSVVDAELTLLRRRRMLILGVGTAAAFALITTLATFLSAKPAAISPSGRGPTLEGLSAAGGATEAFRIGTGFLGVFVIVTFAARMTMEFSHGTMRTLLVHEPRRWRVVTGKTLALVIYSAGILAVAAGLTAVISVALAPGQDVSTAHWFGLDGAQAAVGDYLSAAAGLLGWAILGTLLGLVFRSVPVSSRWASPGPDRSSTCSVRRGRRPSGTSPACRPRLPLRGARSTCPTSTPSPSHSFTAPSPPPLVCSSRPAVTSPPDRLAAIVAGRAVGTPERRARLARGGRLSRRGRRAALIAHVAAAAVWLGCVVANLFLAISAATTRSETLADAYYASMDRLANNLMPAAAIATIATGLL